jgi:tryptophan 2,3-dioxygenase
MTDAQKEIVSRIEEKYKAIDQNPDVHLEGLVWANPITYWDYILPDALLGLQIQRTTHLMKWCLSCIIKLMSCCLK